MAKKPSRLPEVLEVVYSTERWTLLEKLRAKALQLMEALAKFNMEAITHGSIARGDVTEKSDVDIFVLHPPSSFLIETALEQAEIPINRRLVVQATPTYAMKGYIEIDEKTSVSFPLMNMRRME
ncbi:MAG: nucleotidyltransferase domain-containing protein, partial [Candidatus Bathyarchaeia archaeon]